jgi:hypothetical protein
MDKEAIKEEIAAPVIERIGINRKLPIIFKTATKTDIDAIIKVLFAIPSPGRKK